MSFENGWGRASELGEMLLIQAGRQRKHPLAEPAVARLVAADEQDSRREDARDLAASLVSGHVVGVASGGHG